MNPSAHPTMRRLPLLLLVIVGLSGCMVPKPSPLPPASPALPLAYPSAPGTPQASIPGWRDFFHDPVLADLIGTAMTNNQEVNILLQEVAAARASVGARRGALFPFLRLGGTAGAERPSRNTLGGATEEAVPIEPGRRNPEPMPRYGVTADFDWEIDVWRKLRNERDAAIQRYLATAEGRAFAITHLVAEIAEAYYDLLALDSQLAILVRMVDLQEQALVSVRLKKDAGRLTELAVRRFEAEVLKNRSRLFDIRQRIIETENRLNQLVGRYPRSIPRNPDSLALTQLGDIQSGLPSDLLRNRPDVRQAELELKAAGLEVRAAAARFYPELSVSAALGIESFTMGSPILAKESLAYGAAGNLVGPLVNRSAIHAAFKGASAHQVAAVYRYQQAVLNAYVEVASQLSKILNVAQAYDLKSKQADAMTDSISLASQLFDAARADYTEVLLTQREALEARVELVELRQAQLMAAIKAYKALGGGVPGPGTHPAAAPARN